MVAAYARVMVVLLSVLLLSWGTFANFNPANALTVTILSPVDGSIFVEGVPIIFDGIEDDDLSDLEWSSDIDGVIGTNSPLTISSLSVGTHTITLTDTDEGGSSSITITITAISSPTCNGKTADEWEALGYTKFVGTSNDDIISGTGGNDIIVSLEGNDDIDAKSGDDIICSGSGDDNIDAGDGNNYVEGNQGVDNITAGSGDDNIFGGNGDDIIDAGDGNNHIHGEDGKDVITSGSGNDDIDGNNGDDCINSGTGTDIIDGGLGNNLINTGICDEPPIVTINSPSDGSSFLEGDSITFDASATDSEDGGISNTVTWTSDLYGLLGTGDTVTKSTLGLGTHTITASVTDSAGNTSVSSITLTVSGIVVDAAVKPILECVENLGDGNYRAHFGYLNQNSIPITIPYGPQNNFTPAPDDRGQPTVFEIGRTNYYPDANFSIVFDGSNLVWTLKGPDGNTRTSTASSNPVQACPIIDPDPDPDPEPEVTNISICHFPPGNPFKPQNIKVSSNALDAHLAHGDVVGSCSDDDDDAAKKAYKRAQNEKSIKKSEIKEKRNEVKQIQNDIKRLKKLSLDNDAIEEKLDEVIEEIKETILELKEDYNYDREYKKELRNEFKEIKKEIVQEHKEAKKVIKQKVDSKISQLTKSDDPKEVAKKLGLDYHNGKTKIAIKLADDSSKILKQLSSIGVVEAKNSRYVQLTVSLSDMPKLRSITEIENIRPPFPAVPFEEPLSEGVYFMNADLAQYAGITGKGIKVAVLDLGFELNSKITDNVVKIESFRQTVDGIPLYGNAEESKHGTAVAEIITDVAPNVDLYLYMIESDIEFASAVDEAINQDIDIIAMSAGWPNFPTDGTSHITKKIEEAVEHGIVFVVPAGNFGDKHWEGTFSDSNLNNWHDFSESDEGLSIEITEERIAEKKPILTHLMWDVGLADVADFELVLVDPIGQIVDFSANEQKTKSDIQFEYLHHVPEIEGVYSIGVLYSDEISPAKMPKANLEIFTINDPLEYPVSHSSVSVPADANGAIVVGAVNHLDGQLEPFSSQGPTNNGKLAPHVVGPDGVTTMALDGNPFYGTSATAPYVAGLAALILETNPNISPEQLLTEIKHNTESSLYSLDKKFDYATGYGTANAVFLIEESGGLG